MRKILLELHKYLDDVADNLVEIREAPELRQKLPVFIGQQYDFYRGVLFNQQRILLVWKGRRRATPLEIAKQSELVRSVVGNNIVFIFPEMEAFRRKRLIQYQIPFIVPRRQIYIPESVIDLRERSARSPITSYGSDESLSAPAQLLLLYHLHNYLGDNWYLNQWASHLGYSRMTVSRAYRELTAVGLCEPVADGSRILLHFIQNKRRLWKRAKRFMQSPVINRMSVFLKSKEHLPLYKTGLFALSQFSQISSGPYPEYAIDSSNYLAAKRNNWFEERPYSEDELVSLERWSYSPKLLAGNSQIVDRLSLCLTLRDDPNERVQAALEEMIESMKW